MKAALRRAAGPAVLFLLVVLFHWRLVLTRQYTYLDSPDLANMEAPRLQFQARELHAGRFPLWDPTQWFGQPFLGQMTGAAYPPHWLYLAFAGRRPRLSQGDLHWYIVLVRFFAAFNAYLLCRYLGRSRTAALAGGLVFALGSFVGSTDWPTVLNGALWAPPVFLFLFRALDGRRPWLSAALSGTSLGVAWLSGHHEVPIYLTLAAAGVWLWHWFRGWKVELRVVKLAGVWFVFAALAGGLQTVPAYEYGRHALRWAGVEQPLSWNMAVPYLVHEQYSLPLTSLAGIVIPGFGVPVSLYAGVAGSLLIAVAAAGWREPRVRLFLALAAAALLFALGSKTPLHGAFYSVLPFVEKARVPGRAISVFGLAAAALSGYGLDTLRRVWSAPWLARLAWAAAGLGAAIQLARAALRPERWAIHEGFLLAGLAALVSGVALLLLRRGILTARGAGIALIAISFCEFHYETQARLPNLADPNRRSLWKQLHSADDLAEAIRREPGLVRVEVDDGEFPANFGQWHGIHAAGGMGAGVTANIFSIRHYTPRTDDLLGITHYLRREPNREGQVDLFQGAGGLKLFRSPSAFPRAWAVHETAAAAGADHMQAMLRDPKIDLRRTALTWAPVGPLELCGGDEVRITGYRSDRVSLNAKLPCKGLVVLADTWFPGWRAEVDGRPAEVLEVYGALRGVVAGAGEHHIEFRYRPWSVALGAAMSASALAGCAVLAAFGRRRSLG